MATNKTFGVVSDSFAFTTENSSLEQFTALHNVDYSVTFRKNANKAGYSAIYDISDIYNFAWGNYEQISIGFGNNYCYMMQELGLIRPFAIDIYGEAF